MSVLIKDMEMPETCDECYFHRYHSGGKYVCVATPMVYPFNLANSKGIRKTWCPLVEVPTPHGDLIGIDSKITIGIKDGLKITTVRKLLNYTAVRLPKTVIEAEEGENHDD